MRLLGLAVWLRLRPRFPDPDATGRRVPVSSMLKPASGPGPPDQHGYDYDPLDQHASQRASGSILGFDSDVAVPVAGSRCPTPAPVRPNVVRSDGRV